MGRVQRTQNGFRAQLLGIHQHHIAAGQRVLEWGSGAGVLLPGLKPSRGLGIDLSPEVVERANSSGGGESCEWRVGDLSGEVTDEIFDHIILDYLTGYLPEIQQTFRNLLRASHARTRLHITSWSTLSLFPLRLAKGFGAVMKQPHGNWLSRKDIQNLLELSGWELIHWQTEQLFPFQWPLLSPVCNRFLVRLPLVWHCGMTLYILARPMARPVLSGEVSCSVIIPARNEAGNIGAALRRMPTLGKKTEIVFVEGNSTDDTWGMIERELASYRGPHQVRAIQQPGKGKWDAVRAGFSVARGDVVVIQDADLTVPPEDLPKFYQAIESGVAEFANGSRLVYPMETGAMRFLNLLGNRFFATALSFILGQPIKDSLCGTKMMLRKDYERAMERIAGFGDFDPFGDFSLLFGAALIGLRIRDVPVRYKDRKYGETNISRFRHALVLLRITWVGLRCIRFFPIRRLAPKSVRFKAKGRCRRLLESWSRKGR
jgi:glycosyltransferase involved in cell wall biosynthesis